MPDVPDEIYSADGTLQWVSADKVGSTSLLSKSALEQMRRARRPENANVTVIETSREEIRYSIEWAKEKGRLCEGPGDHGCLATFAGETGEAGTCFRPFTPHGPHPERPALAALLDTGFEAFIKVSAIVAMGIVSDAANGFDSLGTPATLLRVDVHEWLRRPLSTPEAKTIFAVYGSNESFTVRGVTFCRVRPQWASTPTRGSRIALFGDAASATETGLFLPFYGDGAQMAWNTPTGMLVANDSLRRAAEFRFQRFSDLAQVLRQAAHRAGNIR